MKIIEIEKMVVYRVDTDQETYTRYSPESWTIRMGESDEPVYYDKLISELEALFQAYIGRT